MRIWIALLTLLLLLAAPAETTSAEIVDAKTGTSLCDDVAVAQVAVPSVAGSADRTACSMAIENTVPPPPVLARIFRPPRSSHG